MASIKEHGRKKPITRACFPLARKLLDLNTQEGIGVEVVLLSRNSADTGLRVFNQYRLMSFRLFELPLLGVGTLPIHAAIPMPVIFVNKSY